MHDLQREGIQAIYSSPFLRTLQTAHQVAAALDLPVHVEAGICEGYLQRGPLRVYSLSRSSFCAMPHVSSHHQGHLP